MAIPNRAVFRSQEVCEIAEVQAYVLRSWEAEFPELGMSKSPLGPRVYRRADVERVLRLKHLLFVDGLTLAGARKQLAQEGEITLPADDDGDTIDDAGVASIVDEEVKRGLRNVRQGLHWILGVLNGRGVAEEASHGLVLVEPRSSRKDARGHSKRARGSKSLRSSRSARPSRPARKASRTRSSKSKTRR